jgi:hypothetical protein
VLFATLGEIKRMTEKLSYSDGKGQQVFLATAKPEKRLCGGRLHVNIPFLG